MRTSIDKYIYLVPLAQATLLYNSQVSRSTSDARVCYYIRNNPKNYCMNTSPKDWHKSTIFYTTAKHINNIPKE